MDEIGSDEIDALLAFLPLFESGDESWRGEWQGGDRLPSGVIQIPWFDYSKPLLDFMAACYSHGWVSPDVERVEFGLLRTVVEDPGTLRDANIELIRRLFTTHLRTERTSEGHVAEMARNGHFLAILRRLQVLRASL